MHLSIAFLEFICIRKICISYIHIYFVSKHMEAKKVMHFSLQLLSSCMHYKYFIHLFSNIRKPKKIMHLSLVFLSFYALQGLLESTIAQIPLSPRHQSINIQLFHGRGGSLALSMLGINSNSLTFICLPLMKVTQAAYSS